jgi:uncharacterized protein
MKERIDAFIKKQTVLSLCCVDEENQPYCFSCFYAFNEDQALLYFKSSITSYHSTLLLQKPQIAGTILPDKLNKLAIKGIQLTGHVLPFSHPMALNAATEYHRKYPFAVAIPGEVWAIQLDAVKMTDNAIGFAKKLTWKRDEAMTMA